MDDLHLSCTAITNLELTEHKDRNKPRVSSAASGYCIRVAARAPAFSALTPTKELRTPLYNTTHFKKTKKKTNIYQSGWMHLGENALLAALPGAVMTFLYQMASQPQMSPLCVI